ncbi:hypothetical protein GQ53DRAFT_772844 [Thozetella sp. PMI_491]|nr:hypothetical protein GQ53DRAFT_772844 [Thozetella sp. PMI_491]
MRSTFVLSALIHAASAALEVDLSSPDSIKQAAKLVAADLYSYYPGDQPGKTPGILPGPPPDGPYFWWEAGAMWGTYVDYWHFTGDDKYNNETLRSLVFQAEAPANSYMPLNWTGSLGNDDQGFWGMSAMLAAEVNFPNPPAGQPQWLALAQAVFNTQVPRWDDTDCEGGLRWQTQVLNTGYDYKNTIANGVLFNIAARLARYTGNDTYAFYANRQWDWIAMRQYIDQDWNVYDGGHIADQCKGVDKAQFSYNAATLLQGAAFMFNHTNGTEQDKWRTRVDGLLNRTIEFFFLNGTIVERPCELDDRNNCNWDQRSFKGYMLRWMATVTQVAPHTRETILPVLKTSTEGAVKACSGGDNGRRCGFRWNTGGFDDVTGAGEQMSALAALSSLLISFETVQTTGPLTNSTGGTSVGDPSAGQDPTQIPPPPVTTADKAGAALVTIIVVVGLSSILAWCRVDLMIHKVLLSLKYPVKYTDGTLSSGCRGGRNRFRRNRAGYPLDPPKDPAWTSHIKGKNGYIIRVKLQGGYKVYRPEYICNTTRWYHMYDAKCHHGGGSHGIWQALEPGQPHRRIRLNENYTLWYSYHPDACLGACCNKIWDKKPVGKAPNQRKQAGALRLTDNPVDDGRELATSEATLPSDRRHTSSLRGVNTVAAGPDTRQTRELYRIGILYDQMDVTETFDLGNIIRNEPAYTVRVVPWKKKSEKNRAPRSTSSRGIQDAYLVDECDRLCEFLGGERWELCALDDDVLSVAESWVVMEEDKDVESIAEEEAHIST